MLEVQLFLLAFQMSNKIFENEFDFKQETNLKIQLLMYIIWRLFSIQFSVMNI